MKHLSLRGAETLGSWKFFEIMKGVIMKDAKDGREKVVIDVWNTEDGYEIIRVYRKSSIAGLYNPPRNTIDGGFFYYDIDTKQGEITFLDYINKKKELQMSEEKVIKLVKEELNITLDSMEIDKVKGDFSDPDDAINLGWVEGIKYALNVIERKKSLFTNDPEQINQLALKFNNKYISEEK